MRFDKFIKTVAPVIAMAVATGMAGSGCDKPNFRFNGKEGSPLDELDLSGDVPDAIDLVGPDIVRISEGADFTIALEGDDEAKARMRFLFEDGTLTIMRDRENWGDEDEARATVSITMPPPEKLVVAGSGEIHSDTLARDANISIAGSGRVSTPAIEVDRLDVNLAGSGRYSAGGRAERLELNVAGSGNAKMGKLKVERAKVKIAGSGNASFASDGKVDARIMGSGNITVRGNPRCSLKSFGSGTLNCEPADEVDED
jgi:hypothetical protein